MEDEMARNISRIVDAKKYPERFPFAYSTLRSKYHKGELKGVLFSYSGRLWFDHDAWSELMEEKRLESIRE